MRIELNDTNNKLNSEKNNEIKNNDKKNNDKKIDSKEDLKPEEKSVKDTDNSDEKDSSNLTEKEYLKQEKEKQKAIRKEKYKQLSFKQKLIYFKDYYLLKIGIALFLLICAAWIVKDVFFQKKVIYSGGLIGCSITEEGNYILTEGFLHYLFNDTDSVELYENLAMSYDMDQLYYSGDIDTVIYTQIAGGMFNYMIIDESYAKAYCRDDMMLDCSEFVEKHNLQEYAYESNGVTVAFEIPAEIAEKLGLSSADGKFYMGFYKAKEPNIEDDVFWDYLNQLQ